LATEGRKRLLTPDIAFTKSEMDPATVARKLGAQRRA
jgi:hypothetical protein